MKPYYDLFLDERLGYNEASQPGVISTEAGSNQSSLQQKGNVMAGYQPTAGTLLPQPSRFPLSNSRKPLPTESGRLTVISLAAFRVRISSRPRPWVVCECSCGNVLAVDLENLKSGLTRSCGCLHNEQLVERFTKHGLSQAKAVHPLYVKWNSIKARCYNPKNKHYADYGGRGIVVCDEWINSAELFAEWAIKNGWSPGLQIDRVDNDGPYSPDNCRFVTPKVNVRNRRSTRFLTAFGETKPMGDWADDPRCRVGYAAMSTRLILGWTAEDAIATPRRGT